MQSHEARHYHAEHHDQSVHGDHLIVELRLGELDSGLEQFKADDHRHRPGNKKQRKAEPQIEGTDLFMVGGQQPASCKRQQRRAVGNYVFCMLSPT